MNEENRNQTQSKQTKDRARFERDELAKALSPDLDFPKESNGTGGQK
jgi:hypothetical protein